MAVSVVETPRAAFLAGSRFVSFPFCPLFRSVPFRFDINFEIQIHIRSISIFRITLRFDIQIHIRSVSIFRSVPF
jgi:hypothetical protein